MKITKICTHVLEARLSQPFAYSRAWYDTRMAMIVEIETDEGITGWGECYGPAWLTAAAVKVMRPGFSAGVLCTRSRSGKTCMHACAITGKRVR